MSPEVDIPADGVTLKGNADVPERARGVVLFAHGTGSGRHSPRNNYVADMLRGEGFATLLVDLLTEKEENEDLQTGHLRFDIEFLARRLSTTADWLGQNPETRGLPTGYFGASTGAAAALVAAAERPGKVGAVVSRGGRPDLASDEYLSSVRAPTLLIVGGEDTTVLRLNREAMDHLEAEKRLETVAGATHLFEEAGALEEVSRLAIGWFKQHL